MKDFVMEALPKFVKAYADRDEIVLMLSKWNGGRIIMTDLPNGFVDDGEERVYTQITMDGYQAFEDGVYTVLDMLEGERGSFDPQPYQEKIDGLLWKALFDAVETEEVQKTIQSSEKNFTFLKRDEGDNWDVVNLLTEEKVVMEGCED